MQGIPCWGERLAKLQKIFVESFKKSSPDFQSEHGYAIDEPNQANLNICAHAVWQCICDLSEAHCSLLAATSLHNMQHVDRQGRKRCGFGSARPAQHL